MRTRTLLVGGSALLAVVLTTPAYAQCGCGYGGIGGMAMLAGTAMPPP